MKITLPDPNRYFGIRFESIGGLGAHTTGQILSTAAVLRMNLNGAHFSSSGSEKKGSQVRSFIRLAPPEKQIRSTAPIDSPDVIVVFHNGLLKNQASIAGIKADGIVIYNGAADDELPAILSKLPNTTKLIRVDAGRIATEEKSSISVVLLGTLMESIPFFSVLPFSDEFATHYSEAVASNEKAYQRGATEFDILTDVGKGTGNLPIIRSEPIWGYETAPIGGILPLPGNMLSNDLTFSRTGRIPVFEIEKCVHCGLCDVVCPDLCFVWKPAANNEVHLQGIDYQYCKGCLRCIETCSTGALRRKMETPGLADKLRVKLFPDGGI